MSLKEEKERADIYYKREQIERDLKRALQDSQEEPGLSLKDIAKVIKKVLKQEQIESLISSLL